jgi:hypothetical protein
MIDPRLEGKHHAVSTLNTAVDRICRKELVASRRLAGDKHLNGGYRMRKKRKMLHCSAQCFSCEQNVHSHAFPPVEM